ncbi:MAG: hypothetical protein AUF79_10280 [Crenarchaeota archaeon 13_1_20CM_2_51_8]|nr:MAG: hypothetical protein AUF79_10280 [Crenarchaeota archaeon 13_1_20CM_2_51_8]
MSWIVQPHRAAFRQCGQIPKKVFGLCSREVQLEFFVWLLACDLRYLQVPFLPLLDWSDPFQPKEVLDRDKRRGSKR